MDAEGRRQLVADEGGVAELYAAAMVEHEVRARRMLSAARRTGEEPGHDRFLSD